MNQDRRRVIAAIILLGFASVEFIGIKPLALSAYKDFLLLDDQAAGILVAVETAGGVLGTIAIMFGIRTIDRRKMALTALIVIVFGNVMAIFVTTEIMLGLVRFLTGLGEGFALGVMSASLAATARPDRNFAIYTGAVLALMSLTLFIVPALLDLMGLAGLYLLLALCCLPAFACLRLVPRYGPAKQHLDSDAPSLIQKLPLFSLTLLLGGGILSYLAIGSFAPFMAEISLGSGLSNQSTANLLSLATLFGLIGALCAAWQNIRWGRLLPLTVAPIAMAICLLSLALAPNGVLIVAITIPVFFFFWLYFFSFLAGLTAALDPHGRATILMFGTTNIGFVVGPVFGGFLSVNYGGYAAMELLGFIALILCLPCIIPIARKFDRSYSKLGD